jgi:hypothetical protein
MMLHLSFKPHMKVKILKEHLEHKPGDTVDVHEHMAGYWERTGVAEKVERGSEKEKKVLAPTKEKRAR